MDHISGGTPQAAATSFDAFLNTTNKTFGVYWQVSPPVSMVGLGVKTTITGYDTAGNPSNVIVLNYTI